MQKIKNITITTIIFIVTITTLKSQDISIDDILYQYRTGNYEQAVQGVNKAIKDPVLGKLSTTWLYRGQIYQAMYIENENKVYALDSAYVSLVKTLKLDPQKEFLNNIIAEFTLLSSNYYRRGALEFNNNKFMLAYKSFEKALAINKTPLIARSDTTLIFYSAISALNYGNTTDAKKLFEKLVFLKCRNPDIYIKLGDIYRDETNIAEANNIYQKGLNINKTNMQLVERLINTNLYYGKTEEALKYIETGKKLKQDYAKLYFYEAELYNIQKQEAKAKKAYSEGLKYKPYDYNANYNLGVLYYNSAIKYKKNADKYKTSDIPKFKSELSKFNVEIMKSLDHLERAFTQNEKDMNLNNCIIAVYELLNRDDDADRVRTTMKINGMN